jgi:hypothetical protein
MVLFVVVEFVKTSAWAAVRRLHTCYFTHFVVEINTLVQLFPLSIIATISILTSVGGVVPM